MGLVTEALVDLLRKQLEARCTLVWYDPEHAYQDLASSLAPKVTGATLYCYDPERGFVWLRRQLEPLWTQRDDPPRLLIYVPLSQARTRDALIEFEVAGAVLQPGQHPPEQNTALAAVARRALAALLPEAQLDEIVGQVEAGHLSLSELDDLGEKGIEALTRVIVTIFGTGNASEVAVRFLSDPALDTEIESRQALGSLAGLLSEALGVSLQADLGSAALRAQLARQVLITDLVEALRSAAPGAEGDRVPQALRAFPLAERPVARQAAAQIAQTWRNRRDLAGSYVHWARRVQAEIGFGSLDLDLPALARTETFAAGEVRLQNEVEKALTHRASSGLIELVEARLGGFWPAHQPEIKIRWEVVAGAGRVLLGAARLENDLKGRAWTADALLSGYAYAKSPPKGGERESLWEHSGAVRPTKIPNEGRVYRPGT